MACRRQLLALTPVLVGMTLAKLKRCAAKLVHYLNDKEHSMTFAKTFYPAAILFLCAIGFQAHAQTMPAASGTVMTEDQIDQRYDADKQRCDAMSGNEKDVCQQKAKADRDSAKADAKAAEKKAEANKEAAEDKRDADYKVAKEKCDAMSGDAKDMCITNAKAQYKQ